MNTIEKKTNEPGNKLVKVVTTYHQLETLFDATDFVSMSENFIKAEIIAVNSPEGKTMYNVQVLCRL